jgi:hypothetical protein
MRGIRCIGVTLKEIEVIHDYMTLQQSIDYTNKRVLEQAAKGRGRIVVVKLDPKIKKQLKGETS